MALHATIVYGPLRSRRLGPSLGINLLPGRRKVCNFECIYCECGWTDPSVRDPLPTLASFRRELEGQLDKLSRDGVQLEHLSFAGNGEPTLHPEFAPIIDAAIELRDRYCPGARIAVLSNATRILNNGVLQALQRIEDPVLKLDAGTEAMFRLIDLPETGLTLDRITDGLCRFGGEVIIQTLLLRGSYDGRRVDNTTDEEVDAWIERLLRIRPRNVMIYAIERQTPAPGLEKLPSTELARVARRVKEAGLHAEYYP
jgi:wyosine [tRNA(Phe)-imidazoG37] synthetase (radical SAM superfamily)